MATKNLLVRVGVDLSDLQAGTRAAQKSFREMANVRKTAALNERSGLLKELSAAEAKVNKLQTDYKRLVQDGGQSKQEAAWTRQLKAAQRELAALDKQWADKNGNLAGNVPDSVLQQYDLLGKRIDEARAAIQRIRMDPASTEDAKRLAEELDNARTRAGELRGRLEEVNGTIRSAGAGQVMGTIADGARTAASTVGGGLTAGVQAVIAPVRSAAAHFRGLSSEVMRTAWRITKIQAVRGVLNGLGTGISSLAAADAGLSASLAQVRGNLTTAFAPIWNAVLPAIQAAISAIATLTNYVANMMANLFGVTVSGAKQSAESLAGMAGAAGSAGSAMEKLKRDGADFDVLHKVSQNTASGGGASGEIGTDFGGVSQTEIPGWMKQVQTVIENITGGLKALKQNFLDAWNMDGVGERITEAWGGIRDRVLEMYVTMSGDFRQWCTELDFGPLLDSFATMSEYLLPVVDKVCGALEWGFKNVLLPFGKWAVEEAFPASLDLVSGALDVLDTVITACQPVFEIIWDGFLVPLAEWSGETFVAGIELVSDALHMLASLLRGDVDDFSYWREQAGEQVKSFTENSIGLLEDWGITGGTIFDDFGDKVDKAMNVQLFPGMKFTIGDFVDFALHGFSRYLDGATESTRQAHERAARDIEGLRTDGETSIGLFSQNTLTALENWSAQTLAGVQVWAQSALSGIQRWAAGALASVQNWASQTMARISAWAQSCLTSVMNFANNTQQRIGGWAFSTLSSVSSWVGNVVNQFWSFGAQAGNAVSSAVGNISSIIGGLISSAWNWGSHFVGNFTNAVRNGMNDLINTVRGMAGDIASYLHFTVPDKGPLATADTWIPDMIDLLSAGVVQNKGQLIGRIEQMTGQMELAMAGGGVTYRTTALAGSYGSGPRRDNDDLIATMRSGFRQVVQAVNDKDLLVELDGSSMSRTVTRNQNRYTRMNGRPVVTG